MNKVSVIGLLVLVTMQTSRAQQPRYTRKKFVSTLNQQEFKDVTPKKDGPSRTYLLLSPQFFDIDDDNQTYIAGSAKAVVYIEGPLKNGLKNGLFTFYLIDSLDHSKRYKIWEQDLVNDQLNGQWKIYSLKGNLVSFRTYESGSLSGIAREFWIDGTVTEEREYIKGQNKYTEKKFSKSGVLESETTFVNDILDGPAKKYYPTGTIMDEVNLKNGELDGRRKYYYPSGAVWIEYDYKDGKPWNIIANYDEKGKKRNPGTLKNGNGTIILYNDDGSARETLAYKNGNALN